MDSKRTICAGDILRCLRDLHIGYPIQVENKASFLNLECDADFVVVSSAGQITEYEIKVSRSDFCRDKHKLRHRIYLGEKTGKKPNRFFYATAPGIITADCLPAYAGWYEYDIGGLVLRRPAPKLRAELHDLKIFLRLAAAMADRLRRCRVENVRQK